MVRPVSDSPHFEARRIGGRHLLLDGCGAAVDVRPEDVDSVVATAKRGLERLGWSGAPALHRHAQAVTVAIPAPPDGADVAVDLLDWAIGGGDDVGLDEIAESAPDRMNPRYRALVEAFPGLVFEGEDLVTIGHGAHARSHPPDELPTVEEAGTPRGVPMVWITGTNGKTTTTRLLAALASAAGLTVGRTSSDGVVIGEETVERGDWTGPGATRRVLRDPRVQFAALETARGGILRRGLALDGADVAIVTNVTPEHLGEWGVDDLDTMARAKLVLAKGLRRGGTLIVPAVSPPLAHVLPEILRERPDLRVLNFASVPRLPRPDGWADAKYLHIGDDRVPLDEIPITFNGTARHNVENALCATLAALAIGIPGDAISRGLRAFHPTVAENPGRMNTFRLPNGALAVLDFAHSPDGLARIAETIRRWPRSRRTLLIGQAGDRSDQDLHDFGAQAGLLSPHRVVLKEVTKRLYGRSLGEVPRHLLRGLVDGGVPANHIVGHAPDELTGVKMALHGATRDDVIVLLLHETLLDVVTILRELGAEEVTG